MLEHYRTLFATLHTNVDHERWRDMPGFRAPHKPLLLLAIIDLLARGSITSNLIELTPELAEEFDRLWALAMGQERAGNPVLPFYHLKTDGFWKLVPVPGKEEALAAVQQIGSLSELQALVQGAKVDESLYELLDKEETQQVLRNVLLETSFPPDIRIKLMNIDKSIQEHPPPRQHFWWVNQGDTYATERAGGYLWAPKAGKDGRVHTHHANVAQLSPGDIVLHYSKGALRAVSDVRAAPVEADRPVGFPGLWEPEGYLVQVSYHELPEPVALEDIDPLWRNSNAGPFTQHGSVKQGYLYPLADPFLQHTALFIDQESGSPTSGADDEMALASHSERLHPLTEDFIQRLLDRLTHTLPPQLRSQQSNYEAPAWKHLCTHIKDQGLRIDERTLPAIM